MKRNYFKGDYVAINEYLKSIHWENALNGLDLAQLWTYFAEKLVELTESFIPVSKVRDEGKKNNPYVKRSGQEAIKKKHTKWQKYKHCTTTANYEVYKKARDLVITELRKGKYLYEKDLAAKIKTDNKLFWGYVRSKSKTKSTVNKLMNGEWKVSESNHETACILNKFFASVFEKEGDVELPEFAERNYSQPLESLLFTEDKFQKQSTISRLLNHKDRTTFTQN